MLEKTKEFSEIIKNNLVFHLNNNKHFNDKTFLFLLSLGPFFHHHILFFTRSSSGLAGLEFALFSKMEQFHGILLAKIVTICCFCCVTAAKRYT